MGNDIDQTINRIFALKSDTSKLQIMYESKLCFRSTKTQTPTFLNAD